MFEDYQQLLVDATSAADKTESVRILAKILAGEDGRDFVSRLDLKDGEMCIEILDHVSRESAPASPKLRKPSGSLGA